MEGGLQNQLSRAYQVLRRYESQDQDKDASQATIPWTSRPCRGWPMRCHGRWRSPSPVARRCDAISKLERRVAYQDQLGHTYQVLRCYESQGQWRIRARHGGDTLDAPSLS